MLKKTKAERMLPLELYYRNVKVTTLALKKNIWKLGFILWNEECPK